MSDFSEALDGYRTRMVKQINSLKPKLVALLGASFSAALSAEIDAKVTVILDETVLKAIDRAQAALDQTINRASQEFQNLLRQVFSYLSHLEQVIQGTIDKIFENITKAIQDLKKYLIDPILTTVKELEEKLFKDINQVLDKIFNFIVGTLEDVKLDVERYTNIALLVPNPLDHCRRKFHLKLTPGPMLTDIDVCNLMECWTLERLDRETVTVREIKEVYAWLELECFKLTCVGRSVSDFQEIFMKRWLDYHQLYLIWKDFSDAMTPQEAYNEAIRQLKQSRDEYQARIADIAEAQATANDAVNRANNAQSTANDAVNRADNAQGTANNAVNRANNAQATADTTHTYAVDIHHRADDAWQRAVNAELRGRKIFIKSNFGGCLSDRNNDGGDGRFVPVGDHQAATWEQMEIVWV